MSIALTGRTLTLEEVVRVARGRESVELAPEAVERMGRTRAVVERALERGDEVYGLTTGVASRKRAHVRADEEAAFNRLMIRSHRVGQGPEVAPEVVRAALVRLVNGLAGGTSGVRPELAQALARALNERDPPAVRLLGSLGQADLALNADLAHGLLADFELAAGESLALLNNNSFGTAFSALALADAERLLGALETAAALDLEAFAASLSIIHPEVAATRPYPGVRRVLERLRSLLEGSYLWAEGAARNLQDPLSFRSVPQVLGATRDALGFALGQLAVELNSSHSNPLVVVEEGRIVSASNVEILPLAAAVDFGRIALAPALTSANERLVKLLQAPISGLPDGLAARPGHEDGLAELGNAGQALTAEARLLAQPVSFELASTTQAEGIEDRVTLAPLGARRLAEMVELGERIVAIELVVAAQAVDLRGAGPLGAGTGLAYELVRDRVPFTGAGEALPHDLEPVRELVRSSALTPGGQI